MRKPPTILVVDDNPATLYSTARILRHEAFTVLEAATGREALALVNSDTDVILLDINLPDLDGFEVCRQIRLKETPHGQRVSIIYLSATFVNDSHKVMGLDSGADGYLTHPIEPPVLIATVNAFLRARRAEEARRESDERFRAIFNETPNGIGLLDDNLNYLEVNPSLCRILDRKREEIIGRPVTGFLAGRADAAQIQSLMESAGEWTAVVPLTRNDGSTAHIEWDISLQPGSNVRLAVTADITPRVESEAEREELLNSERAARNEAETANRLKDEFLATLSHELRNPLNVISMWSQILGRRPILDKEVAEGLKVIERNAKVQNQLISDLLDISRIISGNLRLDMEHVDPRITVSNVLKAVSPAAEAKKIRLDFDADAETPMILCDPERLNQIVWNLITNAVKFTGEGGAIHVTVGLTGSQVEISIADNGKGIHEEFLPHIFERFRQEDATTSRSEGGLGLGLAIVKHLVEMHGGSISATSPGMAKGSVFIVCFPAAYAETSAIVKSRFHVRAGEAALSIDAQLQGVRVLVVDDNDDSRTVIGQLLEKACANVSLAANVPDALHSVEEFRPHVLISDIGMPQQDGYMLIREIRKRGHDAKQLPAIALTALARPADRGLALKAGYQLHLAKPVEPAKLLAAIREVLSGEGSAAASQAESQPA